MISKNIRDKVIQNTSIVEVVSGYLPLYDQLSRLPIPDDLKGERSYLLSR